MDLRWAFLFANPPPSLGTSVAFRLFPPDLLLLEVILIIPNILEEPLVGLVLEAKALRKIRRPSLIHLPSPSFGSGLPLWEGVKIQPLQILNKGWGNIRAFQGIFHRGLQEAQLAPRVVPFSLKLQGVNHLVF